MNTVTRKLISQSGTVLGTITYPAQWEAHRRESGAVRFMVRPERNWFDANLPSMDSLIEYREGCIAESRYDHDAVTLYRISLEEFEKLPHCSFAPSAAYLRSLIP